MNSNLLMTATENICSVNWMNLNSVILAIGMKDGTTELWDTDKMKQIRKLDGHTDRISSLSWNNYTLSTGSKDSKIINHDIRINNHIMHTLVGHTHEVCKLKWSPNGNYLASGGNDNLLCIWDINQSNSANNTHRNSINYPNETNYNRNNIVDTMNNNLNLTRSNSDNTNNLNPSSFIQNNNIISNNNLNNTRNHSISNSNSNNFHNLNEINNNFFPNDIYSINRNNINYNNNSLNNTINNNINQRLTFNNSNNRNNNFFSIMENNYLENSEHSLSPGTNNQRIVNQISPKLVSQAHEAAVKALDWCPWQKSVLASGAGSKDKTIKFWNIDNLNLLNSVNTGSQVCNLIWNQNEKELISSHGFSKNQISIWKYPNMTKVTELDGHMSRVLYLAMSPDGSTIVSGAGDETLRFWKISDNKKIDSNNIEDINSRCTSNILNNFQVR